MSRLFLLALVIGAAVGVPYVSSEWSKIKARFVGGGDSASATAGSIAGSGSTPVTVIGGPGDPHSDETPFVDMDQVFRFDVTPQTVMARWPRVTSGLVEDRFYGMRVPLITGTRYDDLAGALTYYFTASQHCAKMSFSGSTGDPRRLIKLLTDRYKFEPYNSGEAGVVHYQIRWNGNAHSDLAIRPAAVLRSSTPNSRYEIQLTIVEPAAQ